MLERFHSAIIAAAGVANVADLYCIYAINALCLVAIVTEAVIAIITVTPRKSIFIMFLLTVIASISFTNTAIRLHLIIAHMTKASFTFAAFLICIAQ